MHKFLLAGLAALMLVHSPLRAQETRPSQEQAALIPLFIEALSDADAQVRANACDGLANLGLLSLPRVKELLIGTNKKLRIEGVKVFGKLALKGHRYADMLPPLVKAIKDEDVEMRREASFALAQMAGGRIYPSADKPMRQARVINPGDVFDLINRIKGKQALDWPSEEIQKQAGSDFWGDWRPVRGDIGEVIAVCQHPSDGSRVFILKIGKYYVPMGEKGVELLP